MLPKAAGLTPLCADFQDAACSGRSELSLRIQPACQSSSRPAEEQEGEGIVLQGPDDHRKAPPGRAGSGGWLCGGAEGGFPWNCSAKVKAFNKATYNRLGRAGDK